MLWLRQVRIPRAISIPLRIGFIAIVAAVALSRGSRQPAQADSIDVGGNPAQIVFTFPPHENPSTDPTTWQQINVAKDANLICAALPASDCAVVKSLASSPLLSQPLGQRFDDMWAKNKDKSGNTLLQESCDEAQQQTASSVNSSTGQTAYNIGCHFATTGKLTAAVGQQEDTSNCPPGSLPSTCGQNVPALELAYTLSNNAINFTVTKPNLCTQNVGTVIGNIFTGGAGCIADAAPDPQFTVTFDAEVDVSILLPSEPCALTPKGAEVFTHNANLNGSNVTGAVVQGLAGIFDGDAFPAAEQTLDDQVQPISVSLGSDLTGLESGCSSAVYQDFSQFNVIPDPVNGLTFQIVHPLDKAQITGNGGAASNTPPSNGQSLIHPTITAAPSSVQVKGNITVTGNYFPGSNSSQIQIGWADPGDEQLALKESDVNWGTPANLTLVTQQRSHDDNGGEFTATNLKPGVTYQFQVRDCDNVTCSQWSDVLNVKTASSTTNQVTVYLDSVAAANAIGTASPDPNGSFTQSVQIPDKTTAGKHSLIAVGGSNQQSAPVGITVVGANQTVSPELSLFDSTNNTTVQSVEATFSYLAQGSYFTPGAGNKVSIYLDKATGQPLATTTVASDGTFSTKLTIPFTAAGNHTFLAVETVNGQTVQATVSIFVQALPQ